jgi:transporter family-2 protein
MNPSLVVGMMVVSGALMAFQGPINAALRNHVGVFESSLISFLVGTAVLVLIVLVRGEGSVTAVRQASWWQLLGGLIGAVFVTTTLVAAKPIDLPRVAGLALLVVSVVLINWSKWRKA